MSLSLVSNRKARQPWRYSRVFANQMPRRSTLVIETNRLTLVPATVELARSEASGGHEFSGLLGASVPKNWPPETLADALPLLLKWIEAAPDEIGWFSWYALMQAEAPSFPILIGGCGFFGPPFNGTVQIGYSVLSQFQRRGFATEMVRGIVDWAMKQPAVMRIIAETEWENPASVRVLEKVGFTATGSTADMKGTRFELLADSNDGESSVRPDKPVI